ncbi:MAG: hypothetical protein AAF563_06340 [Pseudomonadota bacterium]
MKHAGQASLDRLETMLDQLRGFDGITERKRGIFYQKSKAFLHFHEDDADLFCDVRLAHDADFERFPVTTFRQQQDVLKRVKQALRHA